MTKAEVGYTGRMRCVKINANRDRQRRSAYGLQIF
jgi:hypothetical protein